MNVKVIFLLLIGVLVLSCKSEIEEDLKELSSVKVTEYSYQELPYLEQPYIRENYISTTIEYFDQDSVPVQIKNGEMYYNPVFTSLYGIRYVDAFIRSEDSYYLTLAKRIADRLVEESRADNQILLFPYNFEFEYSHEDRFQTPWYSGMAQGRMLTFFVRMYGVTNESKYLEWAHQTFETFKLIKNQDHDWIGYIDNENYYWIEEYPAEKPIHVLNGFIYAIYGLYDYYLLTKDEESLHLLNASVTTIENYIGDFRNPGGICSYDLKNRFLNSDYHDIHVDQLNMLFAITGETYFKEKADLFENDFSGSN